MPQGSARFTGPYMAGKPKWQSDSDSDIKSDSSSDNDSDSDSNSMG